MSRWNWLVLVTLLILTFSARLAWARAPQDRRGVDVFLGGGISTDPHDDDLTGNIMFGVGYRVDRHWALGLEGHRIKLTSSGMRLIVGPYARVSPFYNQYVNLYGRTGVGLINIKSIGSDYDTDTQFNLVPELAGGVELGYAPLGLYAEISQLYGVRYGSSSMYDTVTSITVGLSLHFFESTHGSP